MQGLRPTVEQLQNQDLGLNDIGFQTFRCLFTLLLLHGHLRYVRTVRGALNYVQTVKIRNTTSRPCLAILTVILTASCPPNSTPKKVSSSLSPWTKQCGCLGAGYIGSTKGHDRGVDWADFHPTLPLIISAADDLMIDMFHAERPVTLTNDSGNGPPYSKKQYSTVILSIVYFCGKDNPLYLICIEAIRLTISIAPSVATLRSSIPRTTCSRWLNKHEKVLYVIKTLKILLQSIIEYLQQEGLPEAHTNTRFELTVECDNPDIAIETAKHVGRGLHNRP
ncbi:hypothetical protein CVT26_002466 [Gymnopilus dilepis]|uniref:Uncharacterized protein n=1 Tax=Gymnopilus dilepis TaxID=231916 RepID=A0A409YX33_9AGAR|nr:hypothetical protein CVT26_002466 [Gymnopilus dilepis]